MSSAAMVGALVVLALGVSRPGTAFQAAPPDFQARLQAYTDLRQGIEAEMGSSGVIADLAAIDAREQALGVAITAARPFAQQGDIFDADAARDVGRIVAMDLLRRSAADRTAVMREVPTHTPQVNHLYPAGLPLATFPPLLLRDLPMLPADLEYRFMGHYLIIRDAKTNLIVDYLALTD